MKDQATFPDNPGVWLKDLASMLNLQLDKIPEGDPVFSGKPAGKLRQARISGDFDISNTCQFPESCMF